MTNCQELLCYTASHLDAISECLTRNFQILCHCDAIRTARSKVNFESIGVQFSLKLSVHTSQKRVPNTSCKDHFRRFVSDNQIQADLDWFILECSVNK